MVCGICAGVQKQVITHLDTSVLETYVMLLGLYKPSLGTITRTLRSRSVHINILLSYSVNYFYMPIGWAKRLYGCWWNFIHYVSSRSMKVNGKYVPKWQLSALEMQNSLAVAWRLLQMLILLVEILRYKVSWLFYDLCYFANLLHFTISHSKLTCAACFCTDGDSSGFQMVWLYS